MAGLRNENIAKYKENRRDLLVFFKLSVIVISLFVFADFTYSQEVSKDNYTGNWENSASWLSWPSPVNTGISFDVTVNGFITANSSVSFGGGGGNLIVNDTLVILGNLTLGNKNNITVNNGGVLIVRGDLTIDNQVDIAANAYIIVSGNFTKTGSDNQGSFTSDDSPSKVFIGGSVTYPGTWASTGSGVFNCSAPLEHASSDCNYGNAVDLVSDPISTFVKSLYDTYYSYQSGSWDNPTTWTSDPGGTTQIGTTIPGNYDLVVILPGRTVTLPGNIASTNLDITINEGAFLDLSTFKFNSSLYALSGKGTMKIASSYFPAVTSGMNTFVNSGGGTTEFYNGANFNLPSQTPYNNLVINKSGANAVQVNNLLINGTLQIKGGTFQINDNTAQRLQLTVQGDVTVDNGGSIRVGSGSTSGTTNPLAAGLAGTTGGYLNYYENTSHRIILNGNLINNGSVRFTNLSYPVFNLFPSGASAGFATVYFKGSSDNTLLCNGQTDFYNLILDKGIDQTFKLSVQSSSYQNFRLFGANISGGENAGANPDLKKALWIKTGTLVLKGLTVIPSLTEGGAGGTPVSNYIIPANGALVLDGPDVIVLTTADNYGEVNIAYGVSGGTGSVNGVNAVNTNPQALLVYGKLIVNDGYLSTRESAGILYDNVSPGQIDINGGVIDTKQLRENGTTSSGASFSQSAGTSILRGRFVRPVSYASIASLTSTSGVLTTRASNGTSGSYATFNINNASNIFSMTGGTIKIYDVCATAVPAYAIAIKSSSSNSNVTGGTFELLPATAAGDVTPHLIQSVAAPFGNLVINRNTGSSTNIQLNTYPINVLKNLTISSGGLIANNLDVAIGGNFTIGASGVYNSGTNTTLMNGSADQALTIDGTIDNGSVGLGNLTFDNSNKLIVAGTQTSLTVQGNLSLAQGVLDDGGKVVYVAGNITNSGTHISSPGTGKIQLNGTSVQDIGGNGNGIFNNLELNNTNAATAPVSLSSNLTINGALTFSQDKLFNINTYNLKLNTAASIVNSNASRYIQTSGGAGDGGITKAYSSTSTSFTFPLGAPTITPARAVKYTPASISLNGVPTTYGEVTIVPVGYEHPATQVKNFCLTYFWRVKSSGFNLGTATVIHGYTYNQSDVVGTEVEYVAARYNSGAYGWTNGNFNDVDENNNVIGEPGSGVFLENVSFIDGDYTAGDNVGQNPFGTPLVFYSRINGAAAGSGLWSNANNWSFSSNTGLANTGGAVPGINDIVVIGGLDSIYLDRDRTDPWITNNVDPRSCATLQIEKGSCLDIGYNTNSSFGLVTSHPNGNGNFRLTTTSLSGSYFVMPAGDFSDFNQNLGTTELYSTEPDPGTTYWLPNGVASYGNLIISPLGGSNIIFPNNDLTIYGDLIMRGQNADSWFCPTWNGDYPGSIVRVSKTITIHGNMDIQGGAFGWYGGNGGGAQNVVVFGDVIVAPRAGIDVWGSNTSQSLSIGGSLINNSTNAIESGTTTRSYVNLTKAPVTFFGNSNAFLTNTSGTPRTDLGNVTINKGSSQDVTLTINIGGTVNFQVNNWLTLQNGTLKYQRTGDLPITTTSPFIIPSTAGLYINTTSDVNIANNNSNNNDVYLSGKLTIINGRVFVGRESGSDNANNDIEYSGGGFSEIDVQGGTLFVNGMIRRNPATTDGVLKYSQSGNSAVIINGQNRAGVPNCALLEVFNAGSSFNMSGTSTLAIVRGGGGNSYGDLYLRPETSNVTGGTIIYTPTPASLLTGLTAASATQNYQMDANIALNNLTITGSTAASTVKLMVNPLVLNGNLTLSNANSIFDANTNYNINVTIKGNLDNNGSYNHFNNTTIFNGGSQSILGTSPIDFYNLNVSPVTSLSVNKSGLVRNDLTISGGSFILGANKFTVNGDVTNNGTYTDNNGGLVLSGGSELHIIKGTGTYGQFELNDPFGARIENDITLQKNLLLTQGILDINQNLLTLQQASNIIGSGYGLTKMIISDGVLSNLGIEKIFGPSGGATFLFPLGVSGKYTPALLTVVSNSATKSIRINNINENHPAVWDPNNVLGYYWEVESQGDQPFSGSLQLNYSASDVKGGPESNYVAARLILPGTSWSKAAAGAGTDNVNETTHKITFNFPAGTVNLSGAYTAGNDPAIPNNIPEFTSIKDGNWNDPATWLQTGGDPYTLTGGPDGFIVNVNHQVSVVSNNCFSYQTTINNLLRIVAPYYGHNLGTVLGAGKLYMEDGDLPAGRFTSFFDCASGGGTLEYGGAGTYTLIADRLDVIPSIIFSGTGSRILPNKDLSICNQLLINGPILDNSVYNRKLNINGVMELSSGAFVAGTGANATVNFSGASPQNISSFSGTNTFNNLEISNASGLTLNSPIDVKGNLLLTDGIIKSSSTNTLHLTNTMINCVFPEGGSSSSYVTGPLTKRINQGDTYFRFPVGNISEAGNKFSLRATQTGTQDWTVEYINPSILNSFSTPLTAINEDEYWNVSAPAGSQAIVNIQWDPASNLTPLMTQFGLSDMRVAEYSGTNWIELSSSASGDDYNGSAETNARIVIDADGTNSYTLGCINTPKPRIRLAPSGAICGTAGIPVTLSTAYTIYGPYTVNYTINGVAQSPLSPASFPFNLPTGTTGGVYQLTGFTYHYPAGVSHTGVCDVTTVTSYTVPTTSNAGPDQSLCGGTSAVLAGNNSGAYSGLWTVVSGTGGTVSNPTVNNSNFSGTNGSTYTLRWTISNGGCSSFDDVIITFPLLAQQPANFTVSSSPVCQGQNDVVYTVPNDPSVTYEWTYSGTGAFITGTTNTVSIDFANNATTGTLSVKATNGCGTSSARSMVIAMNAATSISSQSTLTQTKCNGDAFAAMSVTATGQGTLTYQWYSNAISSNSGGTPIAGATSASYTPSSASDGTLYYYCEVTGGCGLVKSNISGAIIVTHRPNTGDLYRKPNN